MEKDYDEPKNVVLEVQDGFIDQNMIFGERPLTAVIKTKGVKEDGKVSS